jgi:hypothetical protein
LTGPEREELDSLLQPTASVVWQPQPGQQSLGYYSEADELFYGGAAGGGKSDLLLGLGLTAHRKTLVLRREAAQLPELVARLLEIAGTAGRWRGSGNGGTLRGVDGFRSIELAGCEHERAKSKYKGRAHDLKAFDELPDFTESQYLFITGWNRTTVKGQRCRVVGAGNPPTTAEGEWVLRRWGPWLDAQHPRPAKPGELRWYAMVDGKDVEREDGQSFEHKGETIYPRSRSFVPAKLDDNPILKATGYIRTVQNLPEPLRSQLLHGDFSVGREDDVYQVIPSAWVRAAQARWKSEGWRDDELSAVGVDVARGGADKTVLAPRHKQWFAPLQKHPGKGTPDGQAVAGLVLRAIAGLPGAAVNVDIIGVGASAYDWCRAMQVKNLHGINFAEASDSRDKSGQLQFVNLRAWAFWSLREALDPQRGDNLALPPDPELFADLTAARWLLSARGVKIESKEEIIARLGRSPDCADAVVLAHLPTMPLVVGLPAKGTGGYVSGAPTGVFNPGGQSGAW